jgi:hypothetical protein
MFVEKTTHTMYKALELINFLPFPGPRFANVAWVQTTYILGLRSPQTRVHSLSTPVLPAFQGQTGILLP